MLDLIDPNEKNKDQYEHGVQIVYFKDLERIHVMSDRTDAS